MRNVMLSLILGGVLMLAAGSPPVMAEEEAVAPTVQELEKKSGKELYKLTCKPCHLPDSPAGEFTPMTLIEDQWVRFFDKKYVATHGALIDSASTDTTKTEVPDWIDPEMRERLRQVSPKMMEKIRKFVIDGAADGEHPMTCG